VHFSVPNDNSVKVEQPRYVITANGNVGCFQIGAIMNWL
jgi:hypothetical protein